MTAPTCAACATLLTGDMPPALWETITRLLSQRGVTAIEVHHAYQEAAGLPLGNAPRHDGGEG